MKLAWKLGEVLGFSILSVIASAQVPDQVTAYDPGSSSFGMGGALQVTSSETLSAYFNPAGLGYITRRTARAVYGNLPKSFTLSSGPIDNRTVKTNGLKGSTLVTHIGFAQPLSKRGAVIGLSYAIGGEMEDQQLGAGLTQGVGTVANYELDRSLKTQVYSLALAKASSDQTTSFGVAVNYVRQRTAIAESGVVVTTSGNTVTIVPLTPVANGEDNGYGYGFTVGLQGTPASDPNLSWGLSYRSAVDLKGNPQTAQFFSRIPSCASAGLAFRQNNLRGSQDYLVLGGQASYYSGGRSSTEFDRTNQTVVGVGLEYTFARSGGKLPLRIGYKSVPAGGDGFATRNELTYGFGYRSSDGRIGLDAGFGSPQHGGADAFFGLTYNFGSY